jgi:hypothetical protein
MSHPEKNTTKPMSPDEAARTIAAMRAELLRQYQTHPLVQATSAAATKINDRLNAVALRLALLRWQPTGSRHEASIARLGNLVEHAAIEVRLLQDYARAVEVATVALRTIELPEAAVVSERNTGSLRRSAGTRSLVAVSRVLLVSAHENCQPITDHLERCGCLVTLAESPEDALSLLESGQRFDQVVCDATILQDTGLAFAAELAGADAGAKVFLLAPAIPVEQQLDRVS